MLNFVEAADKQIDFCRRVGKSLFTHVREDEIEVVHESDDPFEEMGHYLRFREYTLYPITGLRDTLSGQVEAIDWYMTITVEYPGHFNPRDGGMPPEVDESDCGTYERIEDALVEMVRMQATEAIRAIGEEIMYEQAQKEEEDWKRQQAEWEKQGLCPHGKEPDECLDCKCPHGKYFLDCLECLVASDRAYDESKDRRAMRRW